MHEGVSETPATSKLDPITKNSILHAAGVLDPPPKNVLTIIYKMLLFTFTYPFVLCRVLSSVPSSLAYSYIPLFHTTSCHKFKDNLHAFFIAKRF